MEMYDERERKGGIHWRSYTYTRPGNRDGRQEYVVLIAPQAQDFDRVLHEVGLKLVSDNPRYRDGVKQAELMEALTPELLAPYNVVLLRPTREAVKLDNKPPVIGALEAASWRGAAVKHTSYKIDVRDYAGICRRSVTWASDFVEKYGPERSTVKFDAFLQSQLAAAKPIPSKVAEEQPVT